MTRSSWFLGIDLGTGSCKSVVIDEKASILGFGVGDYSGSDAHDRWQEQDPGELVQAAINSVRNALAGADVDPIQCAGISIGGGAAQPAGARQQRRALNRCHHLG